MAAATTLWLKIPLLPKWEQGRETLSALYLLPPVITLGARHLSSRVYRRVFFKFLTLTLLGREICKYVEGRLEQLLPSFRRCHCQIPPSTHTHLPSPYQKEKQLPLSLFFSDNQTSPEDAQNVKENKKVYSHLLGTAHASPPSAPPFVAQYISMTPKSRCP